MMVRQYNSSRFNNIYRVQVVKASEISQKAPVFTSKNDQLIFLVGKEFKYIKALNRAVILLWRYKQTKQII